MDQLEHDPHEFGRLEGLGEEGIDAGVDTGLDLTPGAGTDDGERKITGTGVGTESRGGREPVEPGHDDVERDHIGPHLMDDIQTLGTVGRGHDLETL